jgi:hypothetical protein
MEKKWKPTKTPSSAPNKNSTLQNTPEPTQGLQQVSVIAKLWAANKHSYSKERRREAAAETQAAFPEHMITAKSCTQTLTLTLILQTHLFWGSQLEFLASKAPFPTKRTSCVPNLVPTSWAVGFR